MVSRLHTIVVVALALPVALLVGGCGVYTFNPKGKSAISSVSVETFANETPEFGLADELTTIVIDAFINDGSIKVVGLSEADAVLSGKLISYRREVSQFDESDQVQSYKVMLQLSVSLLNPDDQSEIWSEVMNHEGIYDANTELEEHGQRRAGERLVDQIISKTTKSW